MIEFQRLSDVADLTVGYVGTMGKKYTKSGVKFLRSLNIKPFSFDLSDIKYIPEEFNSKLKKSELHTNDVVIVRTGVPGTCAVIPPELDGCNCADLVIVKPNTTLIDPYYLCAFINSWGRAQVSNVKVGAIQKHFNVTSAEEMLIPIVDMSAQKTIAKILKNLNDKIFNNNSICSNLEAMAKLLYDYWFVQFDFPDENGRSYKSSGGKMVWNEELKREIPAGWEVGVFGDCITSINTGLNPRDNFILNTGGNIRYLTVKNLTKAGTIDFSSCDLIDEQARTIVHRRSDIRVGDILFASISPLGRCCIISDEPKDWDINESVFSIRPNYKNMTSIFLYMTFMSETFVKKAEGSSTGSVFKGIRIAELQTLNTIIPPLVVLNEFDKRVKGFFSKKANAFTENQQLIALRDFLLPMLMNGQIRIDIEYN